MKSLPDVITKAGVSLAGLRIQMWPVLESAKRIWQQFGEELVVTEATGGVHSVGSKHYDGLAVDLRSRYFDDEEAAAVVRALQKDLGDEYDVVREKTHIHVEYDP